MWRGWVVGAIQGAILAPLTLVDHALSLYLTILGLSAGELSCWRIFFFEPSLLWCPLPTATVWCGAWFCLHWFFFSFCLSFTSTPSVAFEYLGVLQAVQPWCLGVSKSNIWEERNCCNSSLSVIQLPSPSHRHSCLIHYPPTFFTVLQLTNVQEHQLCISYCY